MEKFPLVYHRTERGMGEVLKGKILNKKKVYYFLFFFSVLILQAEFIQINNITNR